MASPPAFGSRSTAAQVTDGIDASGLTAIVTGGSSGIGVETCRILALRGAHVIIAARNFQSAALVRKNIREERSDARVDFLYLDLSSLESVRKFVHEFKALKLPLNILINNAGVMLCPFELSVDGIEMHLATNHIGHFLLTNLLLDTMRKTAEESGIEGRIVILTSSWHRFAPWGGIRFDKINSSEHYTALSGYGQSKIANILHCCELSRRLKEEGAPVTVNCVHPGIIFTNLLRNILFPAYLLRIFGFFIWKSIPQGAATTSYAAIHPDVKGVSGKYFVDCKVARPSRLATDPELAKRLWELSQKLTSCEV